MTNRYILRARLIALALTGAATAGAAAQSANSYDEITTAGKVTVQASVAMPASYYDFDGTTLAWREPRDADTHYLRVLVRDIDQQNFIHGCTVQAALQRAGNKAIGTTMTLHETWDTHETHYGANLQLPDDVDTATLTVTIQPPKGRRMGRQTGDFLTRAATVVFPTMEFPKETAPAQEAERTSEDKSSTRIEWPDGRRPYAEPTPYPGAAR